MSSVVSPSISFAARLQHPLVAGLLMMALEALSPATASALVTQCVGAGGLCPNGGTSCSVTSAVQVQAGANLNCGTMDVSITGSGAGITVSGGSFTLTARHLWVEQGRSILAVGSPTRTVGFNLNLSGNLTLAGQLIAQNAGGGSLVSVNSTGSMLLNGATPAIDVSGLNSGCDGGEVSLSSGSSVRIARRIDAHGKDGGDDSNVNFGGSVAISATGNVYVEDEIRAHGRLFEGGYVNIASGSSIIVDRQDGAGYPKGAIVVEGKSVDGHGGTVRLDAVNAVTVSGPIRAGSGINSSGGEAGGGDVDIVAGCGGISIDEPIDLTGGTEGGGTMVLAADGPITFGGLIDARARQSNGDGGYVIASSGKLLKLLPTAIINADGHNTLTLGDDGEGGLVLLQGCQVDVQDTSTSGATITVLGASGGSVSIEGAKTPLSSTDYSVRVGDKSLVDVTGSVNGHAFLEVGTRRLGKCSNNQNATCQVATDCVYGCTVGSCNLPIPNPDTQDTLGQLVPSVAIEEATGLFPCTSVCP